MKLHELSPVLGSTKVAKRIGRGHGSGQGKTAGKGHKGAKARSGYSYKNGFEGGQMPLQRRVPKRGFTNYPFSKTIAAINVAALEAFDTGATIDIDTLYNEGLIKGSFDGVKILGNGNLTKSLVVQVTAFSAAAKEKIEAAGGKAEVIS
jgi:large subunit ribosomal protein L15